jgi:hypothetical protein
MSFSFELDPRLRGDERKEVTTVGRLRRNRAEPDETN